MKYFVMKRRESVRDQLEGTSSGRILHDGKKPRFPVRAVIGLLIALAVVWLLNFVGWIWGVVAGFRGSVGWGFLNLLFYPITPLIYGFRIRKELGRRAAKWIACSVACGLIWIAVAIAILK